MPIHEAALGCFTCCKRDGAGMQLAADLRESQRPALCPFDVRIYQVHSR